MFHLSIRFESEQTHEIIKFKNNFKEKKKIKKKGSSRWSTTFTNRPGRPLRLRRFLQGGPTRLVTVKRESQAVPGAVTSPRVTASVRIVKIYKPQTSDCSNFRSVTILSLQFCVGMVLRHTPAIGVYRSLLGQTTSSYRSSFLPSATRGRQSQGQIPDHLLVTFILDEYIRLSAFGSARCRRHYNFYLAFFLKKE